MSDVAKHMEPPLSTLPAVHPLLAVLHNTKFRRLWVGQIMSQLGINMLIFLLALMLYRSTHSNAAVSGLFLAYGLPSLFFGMVAGAIVDHLDRRSVLFVAHLLRALMIVPLFFLSHQIAVVYLLVFLYALISQLTTPSEAPLIPQYVGKQEIVSANSLFSFTFYSSMAAGFILAGPVLRVMGREGAYITSFALFLVAAISISGLPKQNEGIGSFKRILRYDIWYILKRMFHDLEEGVRYVSQSDALTDALILLTGTQITLVLLGTLGPGFADHILQIDVRDASTVIVGPAIIGILVGALWVGNKGYKIASHVLISIGVMSAGVILMAVSGIVAATNVFWFSSVPRPLVLVVALTLFFLLGVANSFLDVPANSMLQKEAEGDMRGRVYGMLSAAVGGAGILPVIISGILADLIGVGKVIFFLGIVILLYGVYRLRFRMKKAVQ
jgi:MFS family permease